MLLNEKGATHSPTSHFVVSAVLFLLLAVLTPPATSQPSNRPAAPPDATDAVLIRQTPRELPDSIGPSEQRDSIVAEQARRWNAPEPLMLAISHTENWSGDSTAVSRTGAVGLMQVMPGVWGQSFLFECGFEDLTNRRRNACVGVLVAIGYFEQYGNWDDALRAYVGTRCTARDTYARCTWKRTAGSEYVLTVMRKYGRTDLSPLRDAKYLAARSPSATQLGL